MRAYDHFHDGDDDPHLQPVNERQVLDKNIFDLFNIVSRDTLLYFLRIAILILAYIVVRPLIEACFRRFMTPQENLEKLDKKKEHRQKSLADELLVESEDVEDELDDAPRDHSISASKVEWGGTLRKRQKAMFMEAWEEEQARQAEEEELKELDDILED